MSRAAATTSGSAATLASRADSDSSDNSGSFLSSGGSTLILAFLAIGLFVGGLLVMFSMRRYVVSGRRRMRTWEAAGARGWDWDEAQVGAATIGSMSVMMRRRRDFGKKPELWDCRVEGAEDSEWENILPIAAKLEHEDAVLPSARRPGNDTLRTASSSQNPSVPSLSQPGFLHPFHIGWRDFATQLRPPRALFHSSASPSSRPSTPWNVEHEAANASPGVSAPTVQAQCARIVLAITMPTEKPCVQGVPLYALGITDVQWDGVLPEDPPPNDGTPHG